MRAREWRLGAAITASLITAGPPVAAAQTLAAPGSGPDPFVAHVLNRLTFGPRPGDIARVSAMGVDRWIEQQLNPAAALDSAAVNALAGCGLWRDPVSSAVAAVSGYVSFTIANPSTSSGTTMMMAFVVGSALRVVPRDSAKPDGIGQINRQAGQILTGRLTRAETSDQQLLEVLTDFWENHFSVYGDKLPGRGSFVEWDRVVIRPNALGRFRDLLGAVAHSPAMLAYLDNAVSSDTGLNENYARELLELHTLGVDGGYTQSDVEGVARAFTGWTHTGLDERGRPVMNRNNVPVTFLYWAPWHDQRAKIVLGDTIAAGGGESDGERVLDLLARHPSTARFIARKLAVRFVSDTPSPALVERMAETYRRTDGSIRAVMRTLLESPEFRAPQSYGSKVKAPVELVLSIRRAFTVVPDTAAEMMDLLIGLKQAPFSRLSPEGWPETGGAWMNAGAVISRVQLATRIASGAVESIPVTGWREWQGLLPLTFDAQVDSVINTLLNGQVSATTRTAMLSARPATAPVTDQGRESVLRDLIALALSSPEFQHR